MTVLLACDMTVLLTCDMTVLLTCDMMVLLTCDMTVLLTCDMMVLLTCDMTVLLTCDMMVLLTCDMTVLSQCTHCLTVYVYAVKRRFTHSHTFHTHTPDGEGSCCCSGPYSLLAPPVVAEQEMTFAKKTKTAKRAGKCIT